MRLILSDYTKQQFKTSLTGIFIFTIRATITRWFFHRRPRLKPSSNYLNLGCGSNYISGVVNADFVSLRFFRKGWRHLEWYVDLRYSLKCVANTFDGVFSEHTLEHLYPDEAINILKEVYRILKPGAIFRLTVPDLEKYIKFYNKDYKGYDVEVFKERYSSGCEAVRNLTQNYFHFSTWDFNEIEKVLSSIGFQQIKQMSFGVTQDTNLNFDLQERAWETLYVEARKPFV